MDLRNRETVITGRMAWVSRRQIRSLILARGGRIAADVTRATNALIVGDDGLPLTQHGKPTKRLLIARRIKQRGGPIEIISESGFLVRLGLLAEADVRCEYTLIRLARILGVSHTQLQSWRMNGLIQPIRDEEGIELYDFQQVIRARHLCRLIARGCSVYRLKSSLKKLERWLPDAASTIVRWNFECSSIVLENHCGQRIDSTGQRFFEWESVDAQFEPQNKTPPTPIPFPANIPVERKQELTPTGRQQKNPAKSSNNANVESLLRSGNTLSLARKYDEAVDKYRTALKRAPRDCRLWNNLGVALHELGETQHAIVALRRAIQCSPCFADAYYNLADILDTDGQIHQATLLWIRYLECEDSGEHAQYAQKRLDELMSRPLH